MMTPKTLSGIPVKVSSAQITTHPMFAIFGVLLGACVSVFTGRLLTVGLADLQGAIGADSDAMSWLSTSYNAASMFVGPLTVFLGAIWGPRRVLLWASAVFMTSEFICPFVAHNIGALIFLQFIAGLAAGTYYPLTLSAIIQNLPLKFIYFGVAAYSLDILSSTHIATLLEAWYMSNLSWRWIFWNALCLTPILVMCIYFGLPSKPLPKQGPATNIWGFLYASVAFTLLYCALDQGNRLDWSNSGTIVGLAVSGIIMIAVALIRHIRRPHPMLNLRFLLSRNLLLLGAVLVCFRFLLLGPTLLLPNFLALLHGYRPDQIGGVLSWISIPVMIAAPISGFVLYKVDSRLSCAFGFLLIAIASFLNAKLDPGWTGETFIITELINAFGLAFALTGLLATILRSAFALGALSNPVNVLSLSCWFQTCRLFGAEIGKAIMVQFLRVQGAFHYLVLAGNLDGGWRSEEMIRPIILSGPLAGASMSQSRELALSEAGETLKRQVGMLSISDGFMLIIWCVIFCLVLIGFITYSAPLPVRSAPQPK